MKPIMLSEAEYRDRIYACWLGKNIGGTLGAPYECNSEIQRLSYYDPIPSESAPNDDLDLQLVWLRMLQERGVHPRLQDFADYWMKHLSPYPWNEYGFCLRNLQLGLRPPISGCFQNHYIDEMGSPIRSEIWACVAPADPQLAAAMAWKDAVLDHAGGDGVWGEMFWAALESAAFVLDDPIALIRIGLGTIPIWSQVSRAVRSALWCCENNVGWEEARERVLRGFGHKHPCDAPQNIAFTIIGWLYGNDYGDKLCKAVNCGYDTDCTGATLGSLLGILGGTKGIPKEWRDPIGDGIVLHKFTQDLDAPKTVGELTDQTVEVGKRVLAECSKLTGLGVSTILPPNPIHLLTLNEEARALWTRDMEAATVPLDGEIEVTLHYHGEPILRPGIPKLLSITVERNEKPVPAYMRMETPPGWQTKLVEPCDTETVYRLTADQPADRNTIRVQVTIGDKEYEKDFVMLGPDAGKDWEPERNVATCPNCGARVEACVCLR